MEENWRRMLIQIGIAFALLAIAVVLLTLPSLMRPKSLTSTNISNRTNVTVIPSNVTLPSAMGCNHTFFTGGEKDSYAYAINMQNISSTLHSEFMGLQGSSYVRRATTKTNYPSSLGEITAEMVLFVYMDSNFSCTRAYMTENMGGASLPLAAQNLSRDVPCAEGMGTMNFCRMEQSGLGTSPSRSEQAHLRLQCTPSLATRPSGFHRLRACR